MDPHPNGAYSTVTTPPSPALTGTSLTLQAGTGVRFAWTGQPFNVTIWPAGQRPVPSNMEIARLTNLVGDVGTIVRTQESTVARAILAGDQIQATVTAKTLTDIEARGYITIAAEALLPGSRRLVAGTNISLDTTTPGQIGIISTAAGGGNVTDTGPEASPPAGAVDGDLYFPNDSFMVQRFNGTIWVPWGPISPMREPINGDFAWINQGTASVDVTNGGVLLSAPAAAGDSIRIRKKAAPATPYTITAYVRPLLGKITGSGATYGIGFRQSSDGKLHLLLMHQSDQGELLSIKFTNPTTFSAVYAGGQCGQAIAVAGFGPIQTTFNVRMQFPINWLRISDTGVNRVVSFSPDGIEWVQFHSIGRTDFITADEVVFCVNVADAAVASKTRLLSWLET